MTSQEAVWAELLDPLAAWVEALRGAGDDPDRLEALSPPPPPPAGPGPLPPALRARAARLAEDMTALEGELDRRVRQVGRALAATSRTRPAAEPRFLDESL